MIRPHRKHPLWIAFIVHRISGLCLALFLPLHFYLLGLALNDPAALDGFLRWTEHPLLKFAEIGLVFFLAVHLFGGLRLLALEFLPWHSGQKTFAALAAAAAVFVALLFLLRSV
jgi:fumarate reductase subunit D